MHYSRHHLTAWVSKRLRARTRQPDQWARLVVSSWKLIRASSVQLRRSVRALSGH